MEQLLIAFLDSHFGAGTFLALIASGIGSFISYKKIIDPLIKKHYDKIRKQIEKEEADKKIKDDLKSVIEALDGICKQQKEFQQSITDCNDKINSVVESINLVKEDNVTTKKELQKMVGKQDINISNLNLSQEKMHSQIELLIESDKEDIKAFITREYNYWVFQKKEIDPYSFASIKARYDTYIKENGNTFVKELFAAINDLPRTQTQSDIVIPR